MEPLGRVDRGYRWVLRFSSELFAAFIERLSKVYDQNFGTRAYVR